MQVHLATGCPPCARRMALLERMTADLAQGPMSPVSAELRDRLIALRNDPLRRSARAGWAARARHYVARLVRDAALPMPALAVRGGTLVSRRLYEAGPFEIDIVARGDGTVLGHVLAPETDREALAGATCVVGRRGFVREARLHENGDFRFDQLAPGSYMLMIDADGVDLLVPEFEVDAA